MSFDAVQRIADAVLFEGYILYPYRPSAIKNRKRWNFGTLWPHEFAEAQQPPESCSFHAELLIEPGADCTLDLRFRFLQLAASDSSDLQAWKQGVVRSKTIENINLVKLESGRTLPLDLTVPSAEEIIDTHTPIPDYVATLYLQAELLREELYRLQITLANETPLPKDPSDARATVQSLAFTSAHLLVHVCNGSFVSLLETPPQFSAFANSCANQGVFPVLVGDPGDRTLMLCSPIILYDYPAVAPESVTDFCDGTEMDEMLALRVLTLTDAERDEMRAADPRSRSILERTEGVPEEYLLKLHGAIRGMQPSTSSSGHSDSLVGDPMNAIQPWNPFGEKPAVESVNVFGIALRKGDRVRIWPQKRADILDMTVEGKLATIEAIEQDLEDHVQFAVVFDDDPGKDMGLLRQAGHRFFFSPDEIEPLGLGAS
jgi:hypothetical protein